MKASRARISSARQRGQRQGERGQGQSKSAAELKKRQNDLQRQLQELLTDMGQEGDPVRKKLQEAEKRDGRGGRGAEAERSRRGGRSRRPRGREPQARRARHGRADDAARRRAEARKPIAIRLGRKQGNRLDDPGDSVKVPDEFTVQRARAILDELRKRLGQPSRPPIELDYLERLIKPY